MEKKSNNKAIITAALTGAIHTPTMSPYLPITPQQLIDEILAVHEAGGAVAHLHVRMFSGRLLLRPRNIAT